MLSLEVLASIQDLLDTKGPQLSNIMNRWMAQVHMDSPGHFFKPEPHGLTTQCGWTWAPSKTRGPVTLERIHHNRQSSPESPCQAAEDSCGSWCFMAASKLQNRNGFTTETVIDSALPTGKSTLASHLIQRQDASGTYLRTRNATNHVMSCPAFWKYNCWDQGTCQSRHDKVQEKKMSAPPTSTEFLGTARRQNLLGCRYGNNRVTRVWTNQNVSMHITLQWFRHTQTKSLSEGVGIWHSNSRFLRHIDHGKVSMKLGPWSGSKFMFWKTKNPMFLTQGKPLKQKQKRNLPCSFGAGGFPDFKSQSCHKHIPLHQAPFFFGVTIWCSNETEVWNEWNVVEAFDPFGGFWLWGWGRENPPTAVKHDMVKQRRSFPVQIGQYLNQRLGRLSKRKDDGEKSLVRFHHFGVHDMLYKDGRGEQNPGKWSYFTQVKGKVPGGKDKHTVTMH